MCILSMVNLRKQELNRIYLAPMLQISAAVGNRDGTGFACVNQEGSSVWKTELSADLIENLGSAIAKSVTGKLPVMAHVRAASKNIVVTKENAHPFAGDRFILAHNGRLWKKSAQVSYYDNQNTDTALASDSKEFLDEMEAIDKAEPGQSFLTVLTKCMENHMGKFALMVYDRVEDKHYIARGETADLHIVDIIAKVNGQDEKIGFVVNTKKGALNDSVMISTAIAQMTTKTYLKFGEIAELSKNTVYEVMDRELVAIGEVKENPVKYFSAASTSTVTNPTMRGMMTSGFTTETDNKNEVVRLADRIDIFARDHFLTIQDIDLMFYSILGVPMAHVTVDHLRNFVNKVIPRTSAPKMVRKQLHKLLSDTGKIYPYTYQSVKGLQFPWMLSDSATIASLIKFIASRATTES